MRPDFPKRAVVTAGMPYGNKGLHFGHIGGVFVPADAYARFLRDRIGAENVLFVCGTDCYGSPIDEGYRKLVEAGEFSGSIDEYVLDNHDAQAATLRAYNISLDIFEGSGLGASNAVHEEVTRDIIERLYANGYLERLATAQFYDEEAHTFLNGRQVQGRCPVQGCKSEKAYADECDLGHQYNPEDLIAPVSSISGNTPVMRAVENWYFDLPRFRGLLKQHVSLLGARDNTRAVVTNTIDEFLVPPIIYVKAEYEEQYHSLVSQLPPHDFKPAEKGKASFELEFPNLEARDAARAVLAGAGMRLRTGKALVPFRITGNIAWGVPAPPLADSADDSLTVWCWPESLWAPLSFTRTCLEHPPVPFAPEGCEALPGGEAFARSAAASKTSAVTWRDFWCDPSSTVFQFIGQDNIYFYGVAQTALWAALSALPGGHGPQPEALPGELQQSTLVANYHLLFLDKKASSSGAIKPPMANELLDYYTPEQLRAHFLALGLGIKPVSFQPKPLNPNAREGDGDPVLKEGALLTNVFNRLARSCFYEAQTNNKGLLPLGAIDPALVEDAHTVILAYEEAMYRFELHAVMQLTGEFIRRANKYWADAIRTAGDDPAARCAVLRNAFYLLRVATVLMHPVAPTGTRMIFDYLALDVDEQEFFSWDHLFSGFEAFIDSTAEKDGHPLKELPPRTDFFAKHPSQFG